MDVLGDWGGVQTEDKKIKKGKSMVLCRTVIIPGAVLKNLGERSEPEKKEKTRFFQQSLAKYVGALRRTGWGVTRGWEGGGHLGGHCDAERGGYLLRGVTYSIYYCTFLSRHTDDQRHLLLRRALTVRRSCMHPGTPQDVGFILIIISYMLSPRGPRPRG